MNIFKKLITGGCSKKEMDKSNKKHEDNINENEDDYEPEHCETDFDKQFEHARRSMSTTIVPTITHCEYRGSPSRSNRNTPQSSNLKSIRSTKSPSPLQQPPTPSSQRPRLSSPLVPPNSISVRKSSKSTPLMQRKSQTPETQNIATGKDLVQRRMTLSQQKQAKDFVESLDWIQPNTVIEPQVVQSQMITPQIHICQALPIARKDKAVSAIIPQRRSGPVIASGRVVNAVNDKNRQ
ncbi:hypothetical protein Mgra_00008529 [Meloidogyne graminicola]|uniref:Uncharacterized protein n=1 Tax=Meloidogyne graminicola TaxID=189291 RepID=A0A8S9ZFI9_9BILA|nr:hypothetical protein Mgra_00008529 [Meloidogyne graminicola]